MKSEDLGAAPQDRLPIDSSIRLEQIAAGVRTPFLDKFILHYILVLNFTENEMALFLDQL